MLGVVGHRNPASGTLVEGNRKAERLGSLPEVPGRRAHKSPSTWGRARRRRAPDLCPASGTLVEGNRKEPSGSVASQRYRAVELWKPTGAETRKRRRGEKTSASEDRHQLSAPQSTINRIMMEMAPA